MAAPLLKIPGEDPAEDQSLQIDTAQSSSYQRTPDQERSKIINSTVPEVTESSTQGELGTEARLYSTVEKKEQIKREF
jgi:hypothetical protein